MKLQKIMIRDVVQAARLMSPLVRRQSECVKKESVAW